MWCGVPCLVCVELCVFELCGFVIDAGACAVIGDTVLRSFLWRVAMAPGSGALVTLLGSSYTNVGVQPLMDALVHYCAAPTDRPNEQVQKFRDNFCGMVFKIVHHPMKGVLSFVRVYSGKLSNKDNVYNVNQKKTEKFAKLYLAFADEFIEAPFVCTDLHRTVVLLHEGAFEVRTWGLGEKRQESSP